MKNGGSINNIVDAVQNFLMIEIIPSGPGLNNGLRTGRKNIIFYTEYAGPAASMVSHLFPFERLPRVNRTARRGKTPRAVFLSAYLLDPPHVRSLKCVKRQGADEEISE
jgi:hypothetical protein